jgi:DNA repair exonuclease SbcCD ATPase subunit
LFEHIVYTTVVDLTEEVNQLVLENMEYEKKTRKCEKIQNEIKKKCKEINDLKQKLAIYNSRNVNKKIKKRDENVKLLSQKIEENNETHSNRINSILRENNELEKELNDMNEKVKSMHSNWYRDNKLKSYYKTKMASHAQQEKLHKDHNTKNEKIITDLQNQVNDLERSQEEDITKHELFNQGKYKGIYGFA